MPERNFHEMLTAQWAKRNFVCVGLDSDYKVIVEFAKKGTVRETIVEFNKPIVDATKDLVCAYKLNIAFYLPYGIGGWMALKETIAYIIETAPDVAVILDAKHGDISIANERYTITAFDTLGADAITIHPLPGRKAFEPFLERKDKGVFVICRMSESGADEFQDILVETDWAPDGCMKFYEYVAFKVAKDWNENGNCGLVVGATYPEALTRVRQLAGDIPILIPGIGAQGGDIADVVPAAIDSQGCGMIASSSRGSIFASKNADFAEAARRETKKLRDAINRVRGEKEENNGTLQLLRENGVVVEGHFVYAGSEHGRHFVDKDTVYADTELTSRLSRTIAEQFTNDTVDTVTAPWGGSIALAQWIAHHLSELTGTKVIATYADKDKVRGGFVIRRRYARHIAGKNVLVVEDIINSGKTASEVTDAVRKAGGQVIGLGALWNRGNAKPENVGNPPKIFSIIELKLERWKALDCPLCKEGVPINHDLGHG